jgi:hypothetical protein
MPNILSVKVLGNKSPGISLQLDEVEFAARRLNVNCIFHFDFRHHPAIVIRDSRKCASKAGDGISQGFFSSFIFSTDSLRAGGSS